MGFTEIATSV